MSTLHSTEEEINTLRRTFRRTRRAIRRGTLDPIKGTRLLTQTSKAIASLIRLQRRLEFHTTQQELITHLTATVTKAYRTAHHNAERTAQSKP
ncbi:MAG: hypothetical protein WCD37_18390 [Chloroflexia bacterium]